MRTQKEKGAVQTLFRSEAAEALRQAAIGDIQINTPPAFWTTSLLAISLIVTAAAYLCFGHYTRRTTVNGMLVPATGLITLNSSDSGQVVRVDVRQGERVAAGQVLAEFDNPLDSAVLGNTLQIITAELQTERNGLRQDLITERSLSASRAATLRASIASLRGQLVQVQGELTLRRKEAAAMSELLARIMPLTHKGYVSVYEEQQQQADTFDSESEVKELRSQKFGIQQELTSAEQQLRRIPLTVVAQENDTRNKLAQVEQTLAQNEAQRAWVLKATRPGIVSTLLIKPGQAIVRGQPLLVLLPAGSVLEARLLVPSSAIGFVRKGQRVVLRYQAFPYQKFGLHFGEVRQISRSALSPQEIALLTGEQSTVPLYRVLVSLNRQCVEAYGQPAKLRPGMQLRAAILLDRRRLIEWLLEPLSGFAHRMLMTSRPQRGRIRA